MKIFKKIGKLSDIEVVVEETLKEEEVVSCETCKCLIKKEDANIVEEMAFRTNKRYYCNKCVPNYTKVIYNIYGDWNKTTYKKEISVDEKGEPVGYKKITKK